MHKLFIKNFKAFSEEVEIDLEGNDNLLIYGENGSGKSSIYEAIQYFFFKEKIERARISPARLNSSGAQAEKDTLRNSYNNKINNLPFELKFNDEDLDTLLNSGQYHSFIESFNVLMLSSSELSVKSDININNMIDNVCLLIDTPITFTEADFKELEFEINFLLESFVEDIRIEINSSNGDSTLNDSSHNLIVPSDFESYINEAKLNVIFLCAYFCIFKLKTISSQKKRIIVLDDIITSLDCANRTFLIRYLLDNFSDSNSQLIILTHNTGFYNLIDYQVNNISSSVKKWLNIHLYEVGSLHRYYIVSEESSVLNEIENSLASGQGVNVNDLGNKLRQRFEALLHKYSILLTVSALEENHILIDRLGSKNTFYYNTINNKTVYDLLSEIEVTLESNNQERLKERIKQKIAQYKVEPSDISSLKDCLINLKLYLKTTLHPLSHYSGGNAVNYTIKELQVSINILKKFETNLIKLQKNLSVIENL